MFTTDANDGTSRLEAGEKNIDGINVHYFKNLSNSIAYNHKFFLSPHMISALSSSIHNFDIVHAHDYRTFQNMILYHYAKKHNIPYVLQAHGTVSPSLYQKQDLKYIFDKVIGLKILEGASKLIALTSAEKLQYNKLGFNESNIEIVPNGLDLSKYSQLPEIGAFRNKYSIGLDEKIILYLGRIHKIKGIDLLVRSFSNILNDFHDAKLVVVGYDDGFLNHVMQLVAELDIGKNVIFTGPLYGSDKLEAFVDSNVYVLPSVYETFPLTILEACVCGIPVVVTEFCGIVDWVDNNVGYVSSYDEKVLTIKILELLRDSVKSSSFGKKGQQVVREYFGLDQVVGHLENIYSKALL